MPEKVTLPARRYPRTAASWCSPHSWIMVTGFRFSRWRLLPVRRAPRRPSGPPTAGTLASPLTTFSRELTQPAVHRKRWPPCPTPRTRIWHLESSRRHRAGQLGRRIGRSDVASIRGRWRGDGVDAGRPVEGRALSHVAHVSPRRHTLSVFPLRTAGRRGHVRWFSRGRRREPVSSADIGHRCAGCFRKWPPVLSARRHADRTAIRRSQHGAPAAAGARGPDSSRVLHRNVFGVRRRRLRLSDRIGVGPSSSPGLTGGKDRRHVRTAGTDRRVVFSPDGKRAVAKDAPYSVPGDLWMLDLASGRGTRFTFSRRVFARCVVSRRGPHCLLGRPSRRHDLRESRLRT